MAQEQKELFGYPYPWLRSCWRELSHRYLSQTLPHALLLVGQRGIGKADFALNLARLVLCQSVTGSTEALFSSNLGASANLVSSDDSVSKSDSMLVEDDRELPMPCGHCRSCLLLRAHTHPDLVELEPEQKGKAIKIDQVRELIEFVSKTSQIGGYKVAIIRPANALNINAANALLKCLEEPTAQTLLILVNESPQTLMPTIRSRCQIVTLPLPSTQLAQAWLRQQPQVREAEVKESEIDQMLYLTHGAPLTTLHYFCGDMQQNRQQVLDGFLALTKQNMTPVSLAAEWSTLDVIDIIDWLYYWLKGIVIRQEQVNCAGNTSEIVMAPVLATENELFDTVLRCPALAPMALHLFVNVLLEAKAKLVTTANPNKQMLLEDVLIKWRQLMMQGPRVDWG